MTRAQVHGDDKGLVLPPRVAPLQAVIVPITMKDVDEGAQLKTCGEIAAALREAGVRVHVDDRSNYNPGWKYSYWARPPPAARPPAPLHRLARG